MRTVAVLVDARAYFDTVAQWRADHARYVARIERIKATITREVNRIRRACVALGLPEGTCTLAYAARDALFDAVDCGVSPHDREAIAIERWHRFRGALARIETAALGVG